MKTKARILNILSLLFNIAIVGASVYSVFLIHETSLFILFSVLMTLFAGGISLLTLIFNIVCIVKGKRLPNAIVLLKLIATVATMVTFIFVMTYMAYLVNWNYAAMFSSLGFDNLDLFTYFLVPGLSLISLLFLEPSEKPLSLGLSILACVIPFLYSGFYILDYFTSWPISASDWYLLFTVLGSVWAFVVLIGVGVIAILLGLAFAAINRGLRKAYFKEAPVQEKQSEEQIAFEEQTASPDRAPIVEEPVEEPVEEEQEAVDEPLEQELHIIKKEAPKVVEEPVKEEPSPVVEQPKQEKPAKKVPPEKAESKKSAPVVEEPKVEEKPVEEKKKESAKKAAPTKKVETKKEEPKEEIKKNNTSSNKDGPTKVYHLSKRKEDGMWAITFVGGKKAIKLFKTKKEAEAALEVLTKNQGATALIRNSKGAKAGKFASSIKASDNK